MQLSIAPETALAKKLANTIKAQLGLLITPQQQKMQLSLTLPPIKPIQTDLTWRQGVEISIPKQEIPARDIASWARQFRLFKGKDLKVYSGSLVVSAIPAKEQLRVQAELRGVDANIQQFEITDLNSEFKAKLNSQSWHPIAPPELMLRAKQLNVGIPLDQLNLEVQGVAPPRLQQFETKLLGGSLTARDIPISENTRGLFG
ncbi:intermembrane phospholipid transport protein YdbH family protein [Dongshaea marina]|uniref:intermembrane phospholipid transport protein YdbH family protein n=1 Tax=Dongshaea marina TaxID=2047966 RepID=UPI000D3E0933|nr:hypothetical protein [Dongshaea marina]